MIAKASLEDLRRNLKKHGVDYLVIGKVAAILQGFTDTTQDIDIFAEKTRANGAALVKALRETGFTIKEQEQAEIEQGKDFVQLTNGPFRIDLVFAPSGIERFNDAWRRGRDIEGFPVCNIKDVIASKRSANREKDREALPRLEDFRRYLERRGRTPGRPLETRDTGTPRHPELALGGGPDAPPPPEGPPPAGLAKRSRSGPDRGR